MTTIQNSTMQASAKKSEAVTPRYNLFELRQQNFVTVSESLQKLQSIPVQHADILTEAYIATAFHQAARETALRRKLKTFVAGALALLTVPAIPYVIMTGKSGLGSSLLATGVTVFYDLAYVTFVGKIVHRGIKNEKNIQNPVNIENGYVLDPTLNGNEFVYRVATRKIEALKAKAQLKPDPAS